MATLISGVTCTDPPRDLRTLFESQKNPNTDWECDKYAFKAMVALKSEYLVSQVCQAEDKEPPEFFRKSEFTDITLIVEGRELHFSKYPLMAGSSVFDKMIKDSKDNSRLKLDDVPYKDMIMFLECLHPKMLRVTTDQNLEQVASIAHRFKHEGILHRCEEYIVERFNLESNSTNEMYPQFFFHLKVADKCEMKKAVEAGVLSKRVENAHFSADNRTEFRNANEGYENDRNFIQLSLNIKFEILRRRLKKTEKKHGY